ncbi:hypothetical protein GRPL_03179 [Raoultella planticola ATCC 33531]|nr:hypothetical protein GRPL_03179 [Raoultella planticola ATCC 33531]
MMQRRLRQTIFMIMAACIQKGDILMGDYCPDGAGQQYKTR